MFDKVTTGQAWRVNDSSRLLSVGAVWSGGVVLTGGAHLTRAQFNQMRPSPIDQEATALIWLLNDALCAPRP